MIPSQPDGRYDASSMSGTQAFFCSWTSVLAVPNKGLTYDTEKEIGTRAGMSCARGHRARESIAADILTRALKAAVRTRLCVRAAQGGT